MQIELPFELLIRIATQVALGLTFLHESNPPIIHRDIKSHNILLDANYNAKIGDFGITRVKVCVITMVIALLANSFTGARKSYEAKYKLYNWHNTVVCA